MFNLQLLPKYFHTIRHLRPMQIYWRLWLKLCRVRPDLRPAPPLRPVTGKWQSPIAGEPSLLCPWRFRLLNREQEIAQADDWDRADLDKLWRYHLHYCDDLNAKDAPRRRIWHELMIRRWINENPPGIGSGWEPYPLSLRIGNWIKYALRGKKLDTAAVASLAVQVRYLYRRIEYHLLGNHLLANAKALVFAGMFFAGNEAERWLARGLRILRTEIAEQILSDGGHFERSPMYHALILADILDLANLFATFPQALSARSAIFSDSLAPVAIRMMDWLTAMSHGDGDIALFNDAALGIAPTPADLRQYMQRLGIGDCPGPASGIVALPASGYLRLQSGPAVVIFDGGEIGPDYLPGHAHADTLSLEFSLGRQRIIVDSGTSCYGLSRERLRQRSTPAHNTVVIDGENSSQVWSSFRVARRARPVGLQFEQTGETLTAECGHDGYCRLPGRPLHRRRVVLVPGQLLVSDSIGGSYRRATTHWHLAPGVVIERANHAAAGILSFAGGLRLSWQVSGAQVEVAPASYHPEFGMAVENWCLQLHWRQSQCSIRFEWSMT